MDAFKKLTNEIRDEIEKSMSQKEATDLVQITKESEEDTGTFEVIISTSDKDRHGEIVDINGWETEKYMRNPIVLWGHDYHQLPIGICDELRIEGNKLIAKGRFAPMEANPFAQQIRKLYDSKMLRATSVGFIAREMQGNVITKAELLEFSFVGVPANAEALSLRQVKELGIDPELLKSKGIEVNETEELPAMEVEPKETPEEEVKPQDTEEGEENVSSGDTVEKAGRTISAKNRQTIQTAIDALKSAAAALDELLSMQDDDEIKGVGGEQAPQTKVETKDEVEETEKALSDWITSRKILRIMNNVTSQSLQEINKKFKAK